MSFLQELQRRGRVKEDLPYNPHGVVPLEGVWMCGSTRYGRTGRGPFEEEIQPFFAPVNVSEEWKGRALVIQCAIGAAHSLALTETGQCFSWGKCHVGQLGHGDMDRDAWIARHVEHLGQLKLRRVGCGASSIAVTDSGDLWAWGMGYYGTLGHGSEAHQLVPVHVRTKPVHEVCGTNFCTAMICGVDRELYICGQGFEKTPSAVSGGIKGVLQLCAGGNSFAGVLSDGNVFSLRVGEKAGSVCQVTLPEGAKASRVSVFDEKLAVILEDGTLIGGGTGDWKKILPMVDSCGIGHYGHMMAHSLSGTIYRWGTDGGFGCQGLPFLENPTATVHVQRNFGTILCGSNMSLLHAGEIAPLEE